MFLLPIFIPEAELRVLINGSAYMSILLTYCKFENFRENFIFMKSVKKHICDIKKSRLRFDLPISVNDRAISPFREDFIFTKLRICEVSRK